MRLKALEHYTWDKAADAWAKRFKEIELKDYNQTWLSPSRIKMPKESIPENINEPLDIANYLFSSVLCKPEWIGNHIWRRMLKDLTFGYKCENANKEFYFNESHIKTQKGNTAFTKEDAFKEMYNFRNQLNSWEYTRLNTMSQGTK